MEKMKKQKETLRRCRSCLHIGSSKAAELFRQSSSQTSNITTRTIRQKETKQKKQRCPHMVHKKMFQPAVPARKVPARLHQVPAWFQWKVPVRFRSMVPAWFQQVSRGRVQQAVFRGVHFPVTTPLPQRLEPNRFAVENKWFHQPENMPNKYVLWNCVFTCNQ